jgi:uncharacterized protein YjbI with pentapeptide repeats
MDTTKKIYSYDELKEILRLHGMWLRGEQDGKRADLSGAVLSGADLSGAVLSDADLSGAVLRRAVLSDADLSGAVLSGADLSGAVLSGADLRRAVLSDADLSGAVLSDADLSGAVLSGADLRRAVLSGADLRSADLSDADLSGAVLSEIKNDFILSILLLPDEIPFLRKTLVDGKINGSVYEGPCACLAGTMAKACNMKFNDFSAKKLMPISSSSLRERWFLGISEGHTPENSQIAKITLEWIDEALSLVARIRGQSIEAQNKAASTADEDSVAEAQPFKSEAERDALAEV